MSDCELLTRSYSRSLRLLGAHLAPPHSVSPTVHSASHSRVCPPCPWRGKACIPSAEPREAGGGSEALSSAKAQLRRDERTKRRRCSAAKHEQPLYGAWWGEPWCQSLSLGREGWVRGSSASPKAPLSEEDLSCALKIPTPGGKGSGKFKLAPWLDFFLSSITITLKDCIHRHGIEETRVRD